MSGDRDEGTRVAAVALLRAASRGAEGRALLVGAGTAEARRVALEGEVLVGRGVEAAVRLAGAGVSRRHARFRPGAAGGVVVEDLGSKNGVRWRGERIGGEMVLGAGEAVEIGGVRIEVEGAGSESGSGSGSGSESGSGSGSGSGSVARSGEGSGEGRGSGPSLGPGPGPGVESPGGTELAREAAGGMGSRAPSPPAGERAGVRGRRTSATLLSLASLLLALSAALLLAG